MPKLYMLIGVPGSGKSTWIQNQNWAADHVVVGTDEFVENYAKQVGSTYNEVFKDYMPKAVELMADQVVQAREANKNIIWDQTSTTVKSRRRKLNMLRDYEHIAVVFWTPEKDELARRLANRPGKNIPDDVMRSMIANFKMPTEEEGFSEIWYT